MLFACVTIFRIMRLNMTNHFVSLHLVKYVHFQVYLCVHIHV